jgi:glycosyltransferase involved in cell wall biosynthesis
MKVCVDVQSAIAQRAGVGRYTRSLVQHLAPLRGADELALFHFDFLRRGEPLPAPGARSAAVRWCPGRIVQAAWKRVGWPPFDRLAGAADVYHFPNFILPPLARGRAVVTIHDLSFIRHPEFAEPRNLAYLSARIRETVGRSDAIITDSHAIAAEIEASLGVHRDRIFPIHLGISPDFAAPPAEAVASARARLELRRPYILTVGTVEPRKNLAFLVEVFERMEKFDGELVVAGMLGWKYEPTLERMRRSQLAERIRILPYVPDADLPALYAGAEAFLLASHYEGFGFPPLEAMACGTPVLSSAGGSLREVLGGAATVLDAFDAGRWASEAWLLVTDAARRREKVGLGLERAALYRWDDTARKTWDVYRRLA